MSIVSQLGRQVQIPSEDKGKNAQGGKSPETYDSLAAAKNELKLPNLDISENPAQRRLGRPV
jgi:hypothetical protein